MDGSRPIPCLRLFAGFSCLRCRFLVIARDCMVRQEQGRDVNIRLAEAA